MGAIMQEMIMHRIEKSETKTCVIGRSPSGVAVVTFENETQARAWRDSAPDHRVTFFSQKITTEETELNI